MENLTFESYAIRTRQKPQDELGHEMDEFEMERRNAEEADAEQDAGAEKSTMGHNVQRFDTGATKPGEGLMI